MAWLILLTELTENSAVVIKLQNKINGGLITSGDAASYVDFKLFQGCKLNNLLTKAELILRLYKIEAIYATLLHGSTKLHKNYTLVYTQTVETISSLYILYYYYYMECTHPSMRLYILEWESAYKNYIIDVNNRCK